MSKKPENKDKLNIHELLKNSGVESIDLNKLIGKLKNILLNLLQMLNLMNILVIKRTIKILEMFLTIIEKEKLRKQSQS